MEVEVGEVEEEEEDGGDNMERRERKETGQLIKSEKFFLIWRLCFSPQIKPKGTRETRVLSSRVPSTCH